VLKSAPVRPTEGACPGCVCVHPGRTQSLRQLPPAAHLTEGRANTSPTLFLSNAHPAKPGSILPFFSRSALVCLDDIAHQTTKRASGPLSKVIQRRESGRTIITPGNGYAERIHGGHAQRHRLAKRKGCKQLVASQLQKVSKRIFPAYSQQQQKGRAKSKADECWCAIRQRASRACEVSVQITRPTTIYHHPTAPAASAPRSTQQ
jgi:hypothetical protein